MRFICQLGSPRDSEFDLPCPAVGRYRDAAGTQLSQRLPTTQKKDAGDLSIPVRGLKAIM
jgi:hypothetical protein